MQAYGSGKDVGPLTNLRRLDVVLILALSLGGLLLFSRQLLGVAYLNIGSVYEYRALAQQGSEAPGLERNFQIADYWLRRATVLGSWRAYVGLGHTAMTRGDHSAAELAFSQALARQPDDKRARYLLGEVYEAMGNRQAALQEWKQAEVAPLFLDRGFKALHQGQTLKALADYEIAANLEPTLENLLALGKLYREAYREEEAVATFKRASEAYPAAPEPQVLIGTLLMRQGRLAEAEPYYEAALRLDENSADAYAGLARVIYQQEHNAAKSLVLLQQAVRREPTNPWHYIAVAEIYKAEGNLRQAEEWYRKGANADPKTAAPLVYLGVSELEAERPQEALVELQGALARQPNESLVHYWLGRAFAALGSRLDAVAAYERAIALSPDNKQYYTALGDLHAALGNSELALRNYARVLSIDANDRYARERMRALGAQP